MTGRALPLVSQLDYTDGLCAPFALAAQSLVGGKLALLFSDAPALLRRHDHPAGTEMELHAFVLLDDGWALDAEGRRPVAEMAKSFGVKAGDTYRVETDVEPARLRRGFQPGISEMHAATATRMMQEHGWEQDLPRATGELARKFRLARQMQELRDSGGVPRDPFVIDNETPEPTFP